jgi:hypothetical protein
MPGEFGRGTTATSAAASKSGSSSRVHEMNLQAGGEKVHAQYIQTRLPTTR